MDFHFISRDVVIAVGRSNTILRARDASVAAGATWTALSSGKPSRWHWNAVGFLDEQRGWVGGSYGTIIHSSDGGDSWVTQNNGLNTDVDILGIAAVPSSGAVFVVGTEGKVLRTTDDGGTWDLLNTRTAQAVHAVHFLNAEMGWIAGDLGHVLKTLDGGDTWLIAGAGPDVVATVRTVHFVTNETGWFAGDEGMLYHTTDGETWEGQTSCGEGNINHLHVDPVGLQAWTVDSHGVICGWSSGSLGWSLEEFSNSVAMNAVKQWEMDFPLALGNYGEFKRY
eukprot:gene2210-2918_t